MAIRDLLVTLIVFSALPFVLVRPWLGILLWSWLGYMNPHRLSWGFAYNFPFAQAAAVATLLGLLFTRDRRGLPMNGITVTWLLFIAWMTITTIMALDQVEAWPLWLKMMKIQLVTFLTIFLIRSRERVIALIWVIALSLGFYGLKGGLFVFRSGGEWQVWGPAGTFIEDNNALALAIIMTLPLLWFLFRQSSQRWIRWGIALTMLLCCASVLGSHSRGAALAGGVMLGMLWLKSSGKLLTGVAMILFIPLLVMSMPEKWFQRMETVATYDQDRSAMGRVRAWEFSLDMALQRPIGGGFGAFTEENYRRYAPDISEKIDTIGGGRFQEAHSIYFKVLGDHGFPGLALFLGLGILSYRAAASVVRRARDAPDLEWAGNLAAMLQVSMVGYAIGGAFLGLSYFDLYYHLLAIILVLGAIVAEQPVVPAVDAAAPVLLDDMAGADSRAART
jgi:probable O-glycosylation ligase (exosortase A-associated)